MIGVFFVCLFLFFLFLFGLLWVTWVKLFVSLEFVIPYSWAMLFWSVDYRIPWPLCGFPQRFQFCFSFLPLHGESCSVWLHTLCTLLTISNPLLYGMCLNTIHSLYHSLSWLFWFPVAVISWVFCKRIGTCAFAFCKKCKNQWVHCWKKISLVHKLVAYMEIWSCLGCYFLVHHTSGLFHGLVCCVVQEHSGVGQNGWTLAWPFHSGSTSMPSPCTSESVAVDLNIILTWQELFCYLDPIAEFKCRRTRQCPQYCPLSSSSWICPLGAWHLPGHLLLGMAHLSAGASKRST